MGERGTMMRHSGNELVLSRSTLLSIAEEATGPKRRKREDNCSEYNWKREGERPRPGMLPTNARSGRVVIGRRISTKLHLCFPLCRDYEHPPGLF
jgi:hypothetical protein